MATNKIAAVFVLCIVVAAAVNVVLVAGLYKIEKCDNGCYDRCMAGNKGATAAYCKASCDEACLNNHIASTEMSHGSRHEQLLSSQSNV